MALIERYSMIKFRELVLNGAAKHGYQAISASAGVARSTLYRIISGDITDVTLNTASKIACAIKKLDCLKKKST
jgi:predicted transcriptional regulator